jgi:hypothetical protein
MKKNGLLIILLIYSIFSLATFLSWQLKAINTVTGDEPHYLVMASGLVKQGALEQTAPYRKEFIEREIFKNGLAPKDAQPSAENTHAVLGPNGLFNVHNFGLPVLLTLPFLLGGVVGAKLVMVFFGALVVVVAWKFSSGFSEDKVNRFWTVIAATISLPLIPASNQIYPDVLAGLIALVGLYWFFTLQERRSVHLEALLTTAVVFLPWLQIKFAATSVILVIAIVLKIYFESQDLKRIIRICIIAGSSCLMLALYNYYAFGKISGPYQGGALEISKTSLMVLLGLHLDQNQGFILQNPVNLIGILAVGWMYRRNKIFLILWMLVFFSLIVPNSLHTNWYGGWSFSGRFQWAAAVAFVIPTTYGLLAIAKNEKKIFNKIIVASVLLQLYFFYQYAIEGVGVYNKGAGVWPDSYSIFYYPIQAWLPMLYDSGWAYMYMPNYFWVILVAALLLLGFFVKEIKFKNVKILLFSLILLFLLAGLQKNHQKSQFLFKAEQLPSQTGRIVNSSRFAEKNVDGPGFVNYGPYFLLRKGSYKVVISYKSSSSKSEVIGWADIFNATLRSELIKVPIQGTDNELSELIIEFESADWRPNSFEFRTYWLGLSNIEIHNIFLEKFNF